MPSADHAPAVDPDHDRNAPDDLASTYWLVLIVEAVVIAALYWLGAHFS